MDHPFDTTGLTVPEIGVFDEVYEALKDKFSIQHTGYIDFCLDELEVCRQYLDFNVRDSFVLKHPGNDAYILFTDADPKPILRGTHAHTHGRQYQVWALAYMKKDFGRVIIRPETIADKLIELIHPIELDFKDDKAFSDTFYVLIDDYYKATNAIDRSFRNAVMDLREEDFVLEIKNHTLVVGDRRPLSAKKALHMADFVSRLCSLC